MDDQQTNAPQVEEQPAPTNYNHFIPAEMQPRHRLLKRVLLILLAMLVLTAVGTGVYWKFIKPNQPKPQSNQTTQETTESSQQKTTITTTTEHYDSTGFGLGVDYPSDWKVIEGDGSNKLTITSPVIRLTDANSQTVDSQIVLTVNHQGQGLLMLDKGNALATRDSKKISYTHPTSSQRGATYLSFLQYPATTATNALDGVFITGDFGYQKGQAIPKVDISKANPLISVTFIKCNGSACSGAGTPLSISAASWDEASFSDPLETMLKSLTIK